MNHAHKISTLLPPKILLLADHSLQSLNCVHNIESPKVTSSMVFMETSLFGENNLSTSHHPTSDFEDVWFNADDMRDPFGVEDSPAIVSEEESLQKIFFDAESVDSDESPTPGIFAEDLNDLKDELKVSLDRMASRRREEYTPSTPSSIKATFIELPSMISPDIEVENEDITVTKRKRSSSSRIEDAFAPPRQTYQRKRSRPIHPHERALFYKLTDSMRRSRASRREIIQRRFAFGSHPALIEFERHEVSQRHVWQFMSTRHEHDKSIRSAF